MGSNQTTIINLFSHYFSYSLNLLIYEVCSMYRKQLIHSKSTNECSKDTENTLSIEVNTHGVSELNTLDIITFVGSNPIVSCRQLPAYSEIKYASFFRFFLLYDSS